jgi:hypothetical protein
MIFARFDSLAAGESFVLVNSHDPIHLREEFARDRPGAYDWRYLEAARPTDCGGFGSSASPSPTSPACSDTTSSTGAEGNTVTTLSTDWSRAMGLDALIVNAPMGGVAGGAPASAVSRAGGLGMIGIGSAGCALQFDEQTGHLRR